MRSQRIFEVPVAAVALSGLCAAQQDIFYSETWGGPVRLAESDPASNTSSGFNVVEATLAMPQLKIPQNPAEKVDQYTAAYWIGLDGFLLSDSIPGVRGLWQAGVFMSIYANETVEYTGFYEW